MAISVDFDSGTLLLGDGTDYCLGPIEGLGVPDVQVDDLQTPSVGGGTLGRNPYDTRVIRIPIVMGAPAIATTAGVAAALDTLVTAWTRDITDFGAEYRLDVDVHGWTQTFYGTPGGLVLNLDRLAVGMPVAEALATFRCPNWQAT